MTRGIKLSRKQSRALKRKLKVSTMCAIMVISMGVNSITVFAMPMQEGTVVQESFEEVKGNSMRFASSGQEPIDISTIPSVDRERIYTISEDGTYTFKGTNHQDDGEQTARGVYIPTSIRVNEGVKATIKLDGVSIINRNGQGSSLPPSSDGSSVPDQKATVPMIIGEGAEVSLELLDDSKFEINQNGSAFMVMKGAKVTLQPSSHELRIAENAYYYDAETYVMNLLGTFEMNGSRLQVESKYPDYPYYSRIPLRDTDDYFGEDTGKIVINGGYFDYNKMKDIFDLQDRCEINGGQFNPSCFSDWNHLVNDRQGQSVHNFVLIEGLETNTAITMCHQFYKYGDEKKEYGTENLVTESNGTVCIDIGSHNLVREQKDDFTMIIKCGEKYYEVKYDSNANKSNHKMVATNITDTVKKINFYSAGDTPKLLDSIYTTVDEEGKAKYHYTADYVAHTYKFYSKADATEEFNFKLSQDVTDVYVVEGEHGYSVKVLGLEGGEKSYTIPYGTNIASKGVDTDKFILIDSDYKIWDGYPEKDMTVHAYPCTTIGDEKYVRINTKDDLETFRENVNNGCTGLNGYLNADIDAGNFDGIGDIENSSPYTGKFLGNRHKVTLAIENTTKMSLNGTCALFEYVGDGCELKGIDTSGTINTVGQYAGGLVGVAQAAHNGTILIDSCSSNVEITYSNRTDSEAFYGGIVGCASAKIAVGSVSTAGKGSINVKNCFYKGKILKGESENKLKQGGIFGRTEAGYLTVGVENCYVDADFYKAGGDDGYDIFVGSRENYGYDNNKVINLFYTTKCGTSEYGEVYDAEKMTLSELAWRLSGGRFDEEYTNSEIWSYEDGSPVFADEENKPIYQVRFVDEGVYEGKDRHKTLYGYTTNTDQTVAAPVVHQGFLAVEGQSATWMVNGSEYQADSIISADTKAVLAIKDTNSYSIEIDGKIYENVSYGKRLSSLFTGGYDYVFLATEGRIPYSKVDGLNTKFTAINVKATAERKQMDIKDADDLMNFATIVNAGYTDVDGKLMADIDISSVSNFTIGNSKLCAYKGHFDGNWHSIKIGIVDEEEAESTGLFRYLDNYAKIGKLTVEGTVRSNARMIGGIVGYYDDPDGYNVSEKGVRIYNCTSKVSIEATDENQYVGGIVGYGKHNYDVVLCNYSGTITAGEDTYGSGIVGLISDSLNTNIEGCYVHMTVMSKGTNSGCNIVSLPKCGGSYIYKCYYDVAQNSTQDNYVEHLSYEHLYDMNTYANEVLGYEPIVYFDEDSKCVRYSYGSYRKPLRITLTDPGIYENKQYRGDTYTDENGHLIFPDMTDFLEFGHNAHWYFKDTSDVEVTNETIFDNECELVLNITITPKHTVSFDGTAGTGSMDDIIALKNDTFTIPSNSFTAPSGKKFSCWEYEVDGERHLAKPGDTCVITGDVTFSAVWVTKGSEIPPYSPIVPSNPSGGGSTTETEKEDESEKLQEEEEKKDESLEEEKKDESQEKESKEGTKNETKEMPTKKQIKKNDNKLSASFNVSSSKEGLDISWGKIPDADGYIVYASYNGKAVKKVKTITSADSTDYKLTKLDKKELNPKKDYKVVVKAYKVVDGKKSVIGETITAYVAGNKSKTKSNVESIKLLCDDKLNLGVGKTFKIKAEAVMKDESKKQVSGAKEFRYASSDEKIAVVNKNGKITVKKPGKCTIYIYAKNGCAEKIKITVK